MFQKVAALLLLVTLLIPSVVLAQTSSDSYVNSHFPDAIDVTPDQFVKTVLDKLYSGAKKVHIHFKGNLDELQASSDLLYSTIDYWKVPNTRQIYGINNVGTYFDIMADRATLKDIWLTVRVTYKGEAYDLPPSPIPPKPNTVDPVIAARYPNYIEVRTAQELYDAAINAIYAGQTEVNFHVDGYSTVLSDGKFKFFHNLDSTKIPNSNLIDDIQFTDIYFDPSFPELGAADEYFVKLKILQHTRDSLLQRFPNVIEVNTVDAMVTALDEFVQSGKQEVNLHFTGSWDQAYIAFDTSTSHFSSKNLSGFEFSNTAEIKDISSSDANDIWITVNSRYDEIFNPNDVPSDWAQASVFQALDAGLIPPGLNGKYQQAITREEFAELVVQLYEIMTGKLAPLPQVNKFIDTSNRAVLKANALNIVSGTSETTFSPANNITREQLACMLTRFLPTIGISPIVTAEYRYFADEDAISDYAKPSVQLMNKLGLLGGVGDNRIDPQGMTTREQAIIFVMRMFSKYIA